MPTINQLSGADTLTAADLVPVYTQVNGDTRKVSLTALAAFMSTLSEPPPDLTVYALAVVGSTFTTTITPFEQGSDVYALLTPGGAFTAGTITLPDADTRGEGQEVLVSCTQAITTLTINGAGAPVNGAPTTLSANGFFRMRFDSVSAAWYRVG